MKGVYKLLTASALVAAVKASLNPITVSGNAFFNGSDRFYVRGVDYQPGGASSIGTPSWQDPLGNKTTCEHDFALMSQLGSNAVRVYTVDNSLDHTECMNVLADYGMYLILDVNTPQVSINRADPASTYTAAYLQHVFATVDAFKNFTNTLGFFAGNEVVNNATNTYAATYVKAVVRDMKEYISKQSKRQIPVGYSAADVSDNRVQIAEYLNCGSDDEARIDFFGINQYEWCGNSSFVESGYSQRVKDYSNYTRPIFFSEFGCNLVQPRTFTEVSVMYSTEMTSVFSGGLVYEWTQEASDYGLISEDGKPNQDYYNLQAEFNETSDPSGTGGYKTADGASDCPPKTKYWDADDTLPDTPSGAEKYFEDGAGTPLGLGYGNSSGSSTASASSTPTSSSSSTSSAATSSSAAMKTINTYNNAGHIFVGLFTVLLAFGFGTLI